MYESYDNQLPKYVRCTHISQLVDAYPLSLLARQDVTWSTLLRETTKTIIMEPEFHQSWHKKLLHSVLSANDGFIFQLVQAFIRFNNSANMTTYSQVI